MQAKFVDATPRLRNSYDTAARATALPSLTDRTARQAAVMADAETSGLLATSTARRTFGNVAARRELNDNQIYKHQ